MFNISTKSGSTTMFMLRQACNPLDVILRKSINSLRNTVMTSENNIICAITNSTFQLDFNITKEWTQLLFALQCIVYNPCITVVVEVDVAMDNSLK